MKKKIAFMGAILFVLSISLVKNIVFAGDNFHKNYLAEYRPYPHVKYRRNRIYNKGLKKFENGDYQGSIDIFSKYITKYSSTEDYVQHAYFMLAFSKSIIGDHTGAIADYTKVIEMDNSYRDAFLNRSLLKELIGDVKGACSDAKRSVNLGFQNKEYNNWIKKNCKRF